MGPLVRGEDKLRNAPVGQQAHFFDALLDRLAGVGRLARV